MPKEVVSAEEVLGHTDQGAEAPLGQPAPVVEVPATPPEPTPPPAGFENPPPSAAPAAVPESLASAAAAVTAEEVMAETLPPLGSIRSEPPAKEEPPVTAPAPERPSWRFVKNIHPGEKIRFKDGTEYVMPGPTMTTYDRELAEKLLAVSEIYHVVLQ